MTGFSLGIDLGTTSIKIVALDKYGNIVASASSYHGIDDNSPGVQADPESWWKSLLCALSAMPVDLQETVALGFSGNMSSLVLVDEGLQPIRPAFLLADPRGSEQIKALDDDVVEKIVNRTGNIPETVFSLSSMLWLRDNSPIELSKAAYWMSAKDYLRMRLTGVVATDLTDAYNSLLVHNGSWQFDIINDLRLPPELFPNLLPSNTYGGGVTPQAGKITGIKQGVPVAVGAGDVPAAIEGWGGLPNFAIAVTLGTSVTLMASVKELILRPAALGKLTVHPALDGSLFALGSLLTGGLALNWLRETMGGQAIEEADSLPRENSQVIFLPYLAGTGSPDFEGSARGTLFGITPGTTGRDISFALFEAIAFDILDLIELVGASYTQVLVSGGGSNIKVWPQIISDVLGLPVDVLKAPDSSALGAAVMGWGIVGKSVSASSIGKSFRPRVELKTMWKGRRESYRRARESAMDFYLLNAEFKER